MRLLPPDLAPAAAVAAFLLEGRSGTPVDLGDTVVMVPTAGAERAIRRELARQTAPRGVLSPVFRAPMAAMLAPDDPTLASPLDRAAAWAAVLRSAARRSYAALLPPAVALDTPEEILGAVSRLIEVSDLLAEAGLSPASPALAGLRENDAPRWRTFGVLYEAYLEELARGARREANEVRRAQAADPQWPSTWRRIVVACVPDLPLVVEQFLRSCAGRGLPCEVLVADPGHEEALFDAWGRPDPEWWATHPVHVPGECLVVGHQTAEEARGLADFVTGAGADGFALLSAAPESTAALEGEVAARGREAYVPEGKPLGRSEFATMVLGWEEFVRTGRWRALRALLCLPSFARWWVAGSEEFSTDDALEACDLLLAERLCETVEAARDFLRGPAPAAHASEKRGLALMRLLVTAAEQRLAEPLSGRALVAAVWGDRVPEAHQASELSALAGVFEEIESSPWAAEWGKDWQDAAQRGLIARQRVFTPAADGAVEISGWLEAPWCEAPVLAVAGCREGALPGGVGEDAFLPDAVRAELGLASQASRYARDAFLLSGLLARCGAARLRLGFARFRPGGEPNRPSRLLLGCPEAELPARVRQVFEPPAAVRRPAPVSAWRLRFAVQPPPPSIRVTGFKHYLECPLRFYLSQVAGYQPFDVEARELGAAAYGTLVHRVLENWYREGPADSAEEAELTAFLEAELDREVVRRHGRHPAPVVRVQVELIRARLRGFAAVQARERRAGWRMIASEHAVKREDGHRLGPLLLTGAIDRVEVHEEHGLRVMDYKTFASPRTPEETHFASVRHETVLPAALITRLDRRKARLERQWIDLQLPLYRRLAARIWPGEAARGLHSGYFLLPADPDEAAVAVLDLDESAQASAEACAAEVAGLVARGVFWPPAPAGTVSFDDFAEWFGEADPADLLEEETVRQLEGRP